MGCRLLLRMIVHNRMLPISRHSTKPRLTVQLSRSLENGQWGQTHLNSHYSMVLKVDLRAHLPPDTALSVPHQINYIHILFLDHLKDLLPSQYGQTVSTMSSPKPMSFSQTCSYPT